MYIFLMNLSGFILSIIIHKFFVVVAAAATACCFVFSFLHIVGKLLLDHKERHMTRCQS